MDLEYDPLIRNFPSKSRCKTQSSSLLSNPPCSTKSSIPTSFQVTALSPTRALTRTEQPDPIAQHVSYTLGGSVAGLYRARLRGAGSNPSVITYNLCQVTVR